MNGTRADRGEVPVNDIAGLARYVPELNPSRYFDEQARQAYLDALVKWPLMARLMGLVEASGETLQR